MICEQIVEYERITKEWNMVSEKGDVEEEWKMCKSAVVGCTEVCGMRRVGEDVRGATLLQVHNLLSKNLGTRHFPDFKIFWI